MFRIIIIFFKASPKAIALFAIILFYSACKHPITSLDNVYHYSPPLYHQVDLLPLTDTLTFSLGENIYNEIKSFNTFQVNQIDYIAFYDQRSESINVYYLSDQRLCKSLRLKEDFKYKRLHKTTVYIKNWDSIFVINNFNLRLFDSSGQLKSKIDFPSQPANNAAMFDSNKLPVLIGNQFFVISRNRVNELSINEMRDWKIMYQFDLEKKTVRLKYPLPIIYQQNLFGDRFLEYNFCYNNRGNFVFSFPADTLLYETDLAAYNHSYFARSQFHDTPISPVHKKSLQNNQGLKEYSTRDSYKSVIYDPVKGYYLRFALHKVSEEAFKAKQPRKQSILIFDEQFHIIGESDWARDYDCESLFFTSDGRLYARTNFKDEYTLQFVRFDYQTKDLKHESLTKQ